MSITDHDLDNELLTRFKVKRNSCCLVIERFSGSLTDFSGRSSAGTKCVNFSCFWRDLTESKITPQIGHLFIITCKLKKKNNLHTDGIPMNSTYNSNYNLLIIKLIASIGVR